MEIKQIIPTMFRCETGEWFNLQYMESIKSENTKTDYKYVVYIYSISGKRHLVKSGFESEEQSEKYVDDVLTAFLRFRGL